MSATEEYGYQRAACQFFIQLARARGVEVVIPPESDLEVPPPLYGVSEWDHAMIKMTARQRELNQRLAVANQNFENAKLETTFLRGAIDDLVYMMNTWAQARITAPALLHGRPGGGEGGSVTTKAQQTIRLTSLLQRMFWDAWETAERRQRTMKDIHDPKIKEAMKEFVKKYLPEIRRIQNNGT